MRSLSGPSAWQSRLPHALNKISFCRASVLLHNLLCCLHVMTCNCIHDGSVLFNHGQASRRTDGISACQSPYNFAMTLPDRQRLLIEVSIIHNAVESVIQPIQLDLILWSFFYAQLDLLHGCQVFIRRLFHEKAGKIGLDEGANIEDIANEGLVQSPHPGAAIAVNNDEALPAELMQRLTDGVGTDLVSAGKIVSLQPRSFGKNAVDDVLAHPLM